MTPGKAPLSTPSVCPRGCVDTDGCGCEWNAKHEKGSLIVLRDHKEPGGVSDTRCARCEGYDLPQNPHAFGCPYDPNEDQAERSRFDG